MELFLQLEKLNLLNDLVRCQLDSNLLCLQSLMILMAIMQEAQQ